MGTGETGIAVNAIRPAVLVERRYGHIGDLLMLTPALEALSKEACVHLRVPRKYLAVLDNLPFLASLGAIEDATTLSYDRKVDVSDYEYSYEHIYQPKIALTKQQLFADALKVTIEDLRPRIRLSQEERSWARDYLGGSRPILLAVKSTSKTRDWPLDRWKKLIERLKGVPHPLIVVDRDLSWEDDSVRFFSAPTVRELFALVEQAALVITPDSGLLHVAGAFGTPCVALFGPTDKAVRCVYPNSHGIDAGVSCAPCWYARCDDAVCMRLITLDRVHDKVQELVLTHG